MLMSNDAFENSDFELKMPWRGISEGHGARHERTQYSVRPSPPTWLGGEDPAGPRVVRGLAFVFNELLRRRCISPTTQGVALLFVSADRFVGKGTAHAHASRPFAVLRATCGRTRDYSVMGSFRHASRMAGYIAGIYSRQFSIAVVLYVT